VRAKTELSVWPPSVFQNQTRTLPKTCRRIYLAPNLEYIYTHIHIRIHMCIYAYTHTYPYTLAGGSDQSKDSTDSSVCTYIYTHIHILVHVHTDVSIYSRSDQSTENTDWSICSCTHIRIPIHILLQVGRISQRRVRPHPRNPHRERPRSNRTHAPQAKSLKSQLFSHVVLWYIVKWATRAYSRIHRIQIHPQNPHRGRAGGNSAQTLHIEILKSQLHSHFPY